MENKCEEDEGEQNKTNVSDCIANLRRSSRNRESHDEIMELEAELRRAYIAKELHAQLLEREAERYVESVRKQQADKLMRLKQQVALENDLRQRSERLKKSEDYRKDLTEQMEQKQSERNMMMEEARREREILTEVDRIREECERSRMLEMKNELAESMRRERLILQEMKLIRCQEDMEAEERKHLENEEYWAEIDERAKRIRILNDERLKKKGRILEEIASVLLNREFEKCERENLLAELLAEDVKWVVLVKEEEERARRKRLRAELVANLEEQIAFAEQCKLRYAEQDRTFGEEIMKKIMEDEKTARLTAEARRRMQVQYREDLARLIETRRKIRDEELSNIQREKREEYQREKKRIERIEEDRKRLLLHHGPNVADFLNRNVLSEDEREIVQKL